MLIIIAQLCINNKSFSAKSDLRCDLVQEYLAAVWSEVLQSSQSFTEDLQQAALHGQQRLLLSLLPLSSSSCCGISRIFIQGLWGALRPGPRGQRLTILRLHRKKKNTLSDTDPCLYLIYSSKNAPILTCR